MLDIAEEAYAASTLETGQREVRETAALIGICWEQNAPSARDRFSFLLGERTLLFRPGKQILFNSSYCSEGAQSIFNLLTELAEETEALIFSMPAPEGGWKCPLCGMPNGRSALCTECGVMRSAK